MATKKKLLQAAAGNAGGAGLNVEEVFSTFLYTGNNSGGSTPTQTITNGIDLAGEGGLVWLKGRSNVVDNNIYDTERGVRKYIISNSTASEATAGTGAGLTSFNSNGFTLGRSWNTENFNGYTYASWTFRKAPKFFDVVTYTGDGTGNQNIPHNLGATPGCIIVKRTDTTEDWWVYHRSIVTNDQLKLNSTAAAGVGSFRFGVDGSNFDINQSTFSVGGGSFGALDLNQNNATYVAYLWAHNNGDGDFGPDGDADIIKCGSYTGNGSADGPEIDLGFEPQWVMIKNASSTGPWVMLDNMRGWPVTGATTYTDHMLWANTNDSEYTTVKRANITSTGFHIRQNNSQVNTSSANYIYIAIRRGTKVPESATEVFDVVENTTTFSPSNKMGGVLADWMFGRARTATSGINWFQSSRLSPKTMAFNATGAEQSTQYVGFDRQTGIEWKNTWTNVSGTYASWYWKRAPNFFDVVAYTGNGTAGHTVSHNLGVAPEMMWVKKRSSATNSDWGVYHSGLNGGANPENYYLRLNDDLAETDNATYWNDTAPTSNDFTLGTQTRVNNSGDTYIVYLFATLDGISKVGSYTGTGNTLNVDCGFTSGARFVLIKAADDSGSWYLADSERGIVAGDDPTLRLEDTGAEFDNKDWIDPYSAGFTITSTAGTSFNASGITYIFYAIA